jgi:NAD(P)H-nitrite reductase large subunit
VISDKEGEFKGTARKRERMARFVDRVGIEAIKEAIL